MSTNLSKVEQWILDAMAIDHFQRIRAGETGNLIWSRKVVADKIPPYYTKDLQSSRDFDTALINLMNRGCADSFGYSDRNNPICKINDEGIFQFKKSLIPLAQKVKDKKAFNKIIDKTQGNKQLKNELKDLGNQLRNKVESEIIDGFINFLIRRGIDSASYIIEILNETGASG